METKKYYEWRMDFLVRKILDGTIPRETLLDKRYVIEKFMGDYKKMFEAGTPLNFTIMEYLMEKAD